MWRPAHGATSRPGPCRPASGYGREVGRPGPRADEPVAVESQPCPLEPAWFLGVDLAEADTEVPTPAPVTP
jgi:hypothetical protein